MTFSLWAFIDDYGMALVAFLGLFLGLVPDIPRMRPFYRYCFMGAFAVICIAVAFASSHGKRALLAAISGGDSFAYLQVEVSDPSAARGPYSLLITNAGEGPMYDVTIEIFLRNPGGKGAKIGGGFSQIVYPTSARISGNGLPFGNYQVEITARNGTFVQLIGLSEDNGEVLQVIELSKDNKVIYRGARHWPV